MDQVNIARYEQLMNQSSLTTIELVELLTTPYWKYSRWVQTHWAETWTVMLMILKGELGPMVTLDQRIDLLRFVATEAPALLLAYLRVH